MSSTKAPRRRPAKRFRPTHFQPTAFGLEVARREGKKIGVNIAQISEVQRVIGTMLAELPAVVLAEFVAYYATRRR